MIILTDQIYYKIQYPIKKAINAIKNVDPEDPFAGESEHKNIDLEKIKSFLADWENQGEDNLKTLIKELRGLK